MSTVIIPVIVNNSPPPPPSTQYVAFNSSDGILITAQIETTDTARAETLANLIEQAGFKRVSYPVYNTKKTARTSFFGRNTTAIGDIGVILLFSLMVAFIGGVVGLLGTMMWPSIMEALNLDTSNINTYTFIDKAPVYAIRMAMGAFAITAVVLGIIRFGTED